jgi:hypothetical protein
VTRQYRGGGVGLEPLTEVNDGEGEKTGKGDRGFEVRDRNQGKRMAGLSQERGNREKTKRKKMGRGAGEKREGGLESLNGH